MTVWFPEPHPLAGLAFGAAVTVAALFIALPKVVTWRSSVPLLHDREVPWRAVVSLSGTLALLGLWYPVLASISLVLGILVFAATMDLTAIDQDLGAAEDHIEGPASMHAGTDKA